MRTFFFETDEYGTTDDRNTRGTGSGSRKRRGRHEQTHLDTSQTAHERRAQVAWLLSSLERPANDGSGS